MPVRRRRGMRIVAGCGVRARQVVMDAKEHAGIFAHLSDMSVRKWRRGPITGLLSRIHDDFICYVDFFNLLRLTTPALFS